MNKFGRRKIALALACASVFGGKTQATNINKPQSSQTLEEVEGDASGNKNLKNKISTPPKDLPKKFYPLWIALSALGLSAVAILGILGIKKLCSKDSGDQGETPNGPFYYGLGNYGSIEELKKAWYADDVFCDENPVSDHAVGEKLLKLISGNKEFDDFLGQDHKQESELAKLGTEYLNDKDRYTFSGYAEIRFDDKGNFECYDNKGKKLNLLSWERFFIDYIAKYTKQKLGHALN